MVDQDRPSEPEAGEPSSGPPVQHLSEDRKGAENVGDFVAGLVIFLIALYIVVVKGVHLAKVETGWGLYLFTFCVLASIFASQATAKKVAA